MRKAILGVMIAYFAVGATEVALHWYAGTQITPMAHSLKDWYLYGNPRNNKLTAEQTQEAQTRRLRRLSSRIHRSFRHRWAAKRGHSGRRDDQCLQRRFLEK